MRDGTRAGVTSRDGTPLRLRLYVQDGCPSCPAALELFECVHEAFPDIDARVIDLGRAPEDWPDEVFAVPTFTLDGAVVSLGTPSWEDIVGLLEARREEERG